MARRTFGTVLVAVVTLLSVATPASAATRPVVTRAALDPALVAGRGADVGFLEQEAENAAPTAP